MFEMSENDHDHDQPIHVKVTLGISGKWRDEPLKVVEGIRAGVDGFDGTLREAVALAREQGATWQQIGEAWGVSRQAAWERFSTD